jgi:hypothetical protein
MCRTHPKSNHPPHFVRVFSDLPFLLHLQALFTKQQAASGVQNKGRRRKKNAES